MSLWASGALEGMKWIVEADELSDNSDSSGVDSETENDMLSEFTKNRKLSKAKYDEDNLRPVVDVTKEEAKAAWIHKFWNFIKFKDSYDFVLTTRTQYYSKNSQVYITYGWLANRDSLKRYGFCIPMNKYNHLQIKLSLDNSDQHIQQWKWLLQQLFAEVMSDQSSLVKSFKIFDQKFNTKILKFIKVLNCTLNENMVGNVLECKSVSLEYISLMRLW